MTENTDLNRWIEPVMAAGEEITECLGFGAWEPEGVSRDSVSGYEGGLIALIGGHTALQLAFLMDTEGAESMACRLLEMERDELDDELRSDALCELANMLAGAVKTHALSIDQGLRLGLPVHVAGTIEPPSGVEHLTVKVRCGGHAVRLLVVQGSNVIGPPAPT